MPQVNDDKTQKPDKFWRSYDQLENNSEYQKFVEAEFPGEEPSPETEIKRRTFLGIMGASMALAGSVGCRKPVQTIVPYVNQPESLVLGVPQHYASVMPFGTSSYPVMVTTNEGRPTKIEGNPHHPSSLGKTNAFMQASILNLYDPDRSKNISQNGVPASWENFIEFWAEHKTTLDETRGAGFAIIAEEFSSSSMARLQDQFHRTYPHAKWVTYSPISDRNILSALESAVGQPVRPKYHFDRAKAILSLDADPFLLDSDNVSNAHGFAQGRHAENINDEINRLYAVESGMSVTGAAADHRLRLPSHKMGAFLLAVAHVLADEGVQIQFDLPVMQSEPEWNEWIQALVSDLLHHRGESIVVAGRNQPKTVHLLVHTINAALGTIGNTIEYYPAETTDFSDFDELKSLILQMAAGEISTVVCLGTNPVYNAPSDLNFALALGNVEHRIHLGTHVDETARIASWHIHQAHFLEAWGDVTNIDGSTSIVQPVINPLYLAKSELEVLYTLITGQDRSSYGVVRDTWERRRDSSESTWRQMLHDGIHPNDSRDPLPAQPITRQIQESVDLNVLLVEGRGFEVVFSADYSSYGGLFSNNGWMQELPDPVTKMVWDNAALISPRSAEERHVQTGDMVRISFDCCTMLIPVWVAPGHADNSITLPLGYGRRNIGRVADGVGYDTYILRRTEHMDFVTGASITRAEGERILASTQNHGSMEGRPLIREATMQEYHDDPHFAQHMVHVPDLQSLWNEHQYDEGYQWGMSIDLNACIGCSACVLACQAENNIPIVGKRQADYGREMHWLRVDRYYAGDDDDPQVGFQPVACHHCEMAPCEQVCPVAATVHDQEGLNMMTYNRCIGTRYCSNNCPYKVRRFNFFNYTNSLPELVQMVQNPDVTVRTRGVMEKCSYCVQRINRVKRQAKLENRELQDGEVMTACQQACPTNAIKFGNLLDRNSEIVHEKQSERSYEILAEFNFRPRTSYQAKLRNPNPSINDQEHS